MNPKGFTPLLILTIVGLLFVAQPTQAGFFDWFSWAKVKTIFIKEQIQESLPASVSEPIKETTSPGETIQETPELKTQETPGEIQPGATLESIAPEKVIYKDNSEQEITIQNLRNQIASLQNQIKSLEKQIGDLLSKSPGIKEIVKEVPIEKIVVKEVIKEVPVEKIVTKEVLVPQTCPTCPSCSTCPACPACPTCPTQPEPEFSAYSLNLEIVTAQTATGEVLYSELPPLEVRVGSNVTFSLGAVIWIREYVPTSFTLKKLTFKLIGTGTNNDFSNAQWAEEYFYKSGDKTLIWDHSKSAAVPGGHFGGFGISLGQVKTPGVSFQAQIDEDSIYIIDGNGKQVKINGDFPIKSQIVNVVP